MTGGAAPKRKGSQFERDLARYLRDRGWPAAVRSRQRWGADRGDIDGLPDFVVEAKNCRALDLAGWSDQAERERRNAGRRFAVVVVKRRLHAIGDSYALMPLRQLVELLGAPHVEESCQMTLASDEADS